MGIDASLLLDGFMGDVTTLRALQLRARLTDEQAAAFCMVSPQTYRRWGKDRQPPGWAVRLMAIKAGFVPWHGWQGWEVHAGRLFPPGFTRHGVSAGEIRAIPFRVQLLAEYERQIKAFRALADQADTLQEVPANLGKLVDRS